MTNAIEPLLAEARGCRVCAEHLPLGTRPLLAADAGSRIVVIGQAPGKRAHESGAPWNDPSGERLRDWMGVTPEQFYDPRLVALLPMGFCYPGTGQSGDLPPRPECAPLWHERMLEQMPELQLTLLIGQYAQAARLGDRVKKNLTATVQAWREYAPSVIPLPHPSPRNNRWLKQNPWFGEEVLPALRQHVERLKE